MSGNVVIFPGQGSQSVGMGRDVVEASPAARAIYERADRLLGFDLSRICFAGPEDDLTRTDVQQPAIFVTSAALWEALRERGASVDRLLGATAGLSLGEYTALYAAGSVGFDEALRLVHQRGVFMQEAAVAVPSGMVSIIGATADAVEALCREAAGGDVLVPANFNCPGQIVISGARPACERAIALADKHGGRAVALRVAGAFHSPLMQSAADRLAPLLERTPFTSPRCPVIGNVGATKLGDPDAIRDALRRQLTGAVQWQASIEHLVATGSDCFVEVGPGRVLTGLMRKIDRSVRAINVSTAAQLDVEALTARAA